MLTRREYDDVCSERGAAYRRSEAVLDLLTSEDQCDLLLKALRRTDQHHVANFIAQNGGQKHYDVVTYQLNVVRDDQLTVMLPVPQNCGTLYRHHFGIQHSH